MQAKGFLKTQLPEEQRSDSVSPLQGRGSSEAGDRFSGHPRVAILMCTYNGAAYLREQLESFASQTLRDWTLYVSDDASTDDTLRVLSEYQTRWGSERLVVFNGPCKGFAENFISLVKRPEIDADYFAFSDQDDVWFSDKLKRSVDCLELIKRGTPALYCSRTRLVDADLKVIGVSPQFKKNPSFKNALVQSLAGANTMLINQPARDLLVQLPEHAPLIAHDWLTYLLVTGCGGQVFYDPEPCLYYRQHCGNLIGANASTRDRLIRFRKMLSGRFVEWNDANVATLKGMEAMLTEENRNVLAHFDNGRRQSFFKRVTTLRKSGVYRQTVQGNLSLMLAVCLGRV
ncbi:Group 2 family glycosyl transferase [Pseudomonas coronafaciens pv. zizaniae]|nr:Group 2 family glycosyl transferase [Pseudomonas coronafaciens pv. zizaniae]